MMNVEHQPTASWADREGTGVKERRGTDPLSRRALMQRERERARESETARWR